MSRKWVLTVAGFSLGAASFLAFRSFLINPRGFRLRPRWNLLLARAWTSCERGDRCDIDKQMSALGGLNLVAQNVRPRPK